ncbi:MAG: hypothetical protein DMF37_05670 [Verrucomicrobia bacterium]|nr:MAG: hypothetical protein DMF37_05670 [Verrucomicrobiota bacterium]
MALIWFGVSHRRPTGWEATRLTVIALALALALLARTLRRASWPGRLLPVSQAVVGLSLLSNRLFISDRLIS